MRTCVVDQNISQCHMALIKDWVNDIMCVAKLASMRDIFSPRIHVCARITFVLFTLILMQSNRVITLTF